MPQRATVTERTFYPGLLEIITARLNPMRPTFSGSAAESSTAPTRRCIARSRAGSTARQSRPGLRLSIFAAR